MPASKKTARRKNHRVTVHDVAREAGVSIATVSYVLNDSGSISDEMRKKVRKAANKLGYRQNRAARAMKMGHTDIIGLIIPNIENPFFATLAQSVLLESQRRNFQVFLVDTEGSHESEAKAMHGLIQQGVDGIIVFPIDESVIALGDGIDVPVVILDRDSPDRDLVQAEYSEGGRLLADHLLQLGHARFGLLEGPQEVASARKRSEGFIERVGDRGTVVWRQAHPFSLELNDAARARLDHLNVTAVVCGNDLIAMGAIQYLQERGIRIPRDISITGFDDIQFSRTITPSLTTIRMPISQMGKEAVTLLTRRLSSPGDDRSRSRVILDVELIPRASTGRV